MGRQAERAGGAGGPLRDAPLRQAAAGHPGHPLTPMGSAAPPPAPAPVQAAEGPGEWAALPSAVSVHSPCCEAQEADDQPRGVRKDLQTTNLGPHRRHCRPGLVAPWTPRISQVPPVPMGAEGGSLSSATLTAHWELGRQGSSEEPGV